MSLRFRSLTEMTADLRDELTGLVDAVGQPRFREVVVQRASHGAAMASAAPRCRLPAAVIVPGASEHPAEGVRNLRRTTFAVGVLSGMDAETNDSSTPLNDLVDAVVQHFLPAPTTPHTQVVIQGVIWEPVGQTPEVAAGTQLSARITLLATDVRQNRA